MAKKLWTSSARVRTIEEARAGNWTVRGATVCGATEPERPKCRRARAEPGRDEPRCPRTDHAVGRPRGRPRAGLGPAVAGQRAVPRAGLLRRRQVGLLGRLVPTAHRHRPRRLAARDRGLAQPPGQTGGERDRGNPGHRLHLRRPAGRAHAGCHRGCGGHAPRSRCRAAPAGRAGRPPISALFGFDKYSTCSRWPTPFGATCAPPGNRTPPAGCSWYLRPT